MKLPITIGCALILSSATMIYGRPADDKYKEKTKVEDRVTGEQEKTKVKAHHGKYKEKSEATNPDGTTTKTKIKAKKHGKEVEEKTETK
jgi:hypothetical protein